MHSIIYGRTDTVNFSPHASSNDFFALKKCLNEPDVGLVSYHNLDCIEYVNSPF